MYGQQFHPFTCCGILVLHNLQFQDIVIKENLHLVIHWCSFYKIFFTLVFAALIILYYLVTEIEMSSDKNALYLYTNRSFALLLIFSMLTNFTNKCPVMKLIKSIIILDKMILYVNGNIKNHLGRQLTFFLQYYVYLSNKYHYTKFFDNYDR